MLSFAAALVVCIWFYSSAKARGRSRFRWLLAGLLAYCIPNLGYHLFFRFSGLGDTVRHATGVGLPLTLLFALGGIGFGVLFAVVVYLDLSKPPQYVFGHRASIIRHDDTYSAVCDCGWGRHGMPKEADASHVAYMHTMRVKAHHAVS